MHKDWASKNDLNSLVDGLCQNIRIMFNDDEMEAHRSDITDVVQRAYELGRQSITEEATQRELDSPR